MKSMMSAVALVAAAVVLQLASASHLRMHSSPFHISNNRVVTRQIVDADARSSNGTTCLHEQAASDKTAHSKLASLSRGKTEHKTKLRVCNAVTTHRNALITVIHNGVYLSTEPVVQRKCVEYVVFVAEANQLEVKLSGQVLAEWTAEKSGADMMDIPILFLVAHVFGEGADTTFSVDEFHGENLGVQSVQVAYMDVFRSPLGAPEAQLKLVSDNGEFLLSGGTYISVCGGEYSLHFKSEGEPERKSSTPANFEVDEQYIILRLAPDSKDEGATESAIVYPTESGNSSWFSFW